MKSIPCICILPIIIPEIVPLMQVLCLIIWKLPWQVLTLCTLEMKFYVLKYMPPTPSMPISESNAARFSSIHVHIVLANSMHPWGFVHDRYIVTRALSAWTLMGNLWYLSSCRLCLALCWLQVLASFLIKLMHEQSLMRFYKIYI